MYNIILVAMLSDKADVASKLQQHAMCLQQLLLLLTEPIAALQMLHHINLLTQL
jgi:hypothetical protein